VQEGTTILTTPSTAAALKSILDDTTGKFKDELSKTKKKATFELFNGVKVMSFGNKQIELHEVKNNHAEGLSFVFLPADKIIYEGDLYSLPDDGTITPAIEITRQFSSYLSEKKLKYDRIIGHHGHSNITPAILQQAVAAKK
jgi:hypothetical protein